MVGRGHGVGGGDMWNHKRTESDEHVVFEENGNDT